MRREFFKYLYTLMKKNDQIWALTGDLGFGGFDKIREDFPDRFINTGAAEQSMMDIAVGLALSGKSPVVYSITPFLLYRPFETLRTYIDHEDLPVIMIGSGRNDDYKHDGFSHFAGDDKLFMKQFTMILSWWPKNNKEMKGILEVATTRWGSPAYINLVR